MKNFRTEFPLEACEKKFSHRDKVLTVGSCFSDVIGEKLISNKFDVLKNPFGVIFNPISVFDLLSHSLLEKALPDALLLSKHGQFYHYLLHSKINAKSKKGLIDIIKVLQKRVQAYLKQSSHVFITLGTSFAYALNSSNKMVANCHKQPNDYFDKKLLSIEEMKAGFDAYYSLQKEINPELVIVLTVSPVRHTRDGMVNNQLSKSQLRVVCQQLENQYPSVEYFPSYELIMDDLRDYRFYKEDMIHPNEMAENYIWEKFPATFLDKSTLPILEKIEKVNKAMSHKPFDALSLRHKNFLLGIIQVIDQLPKEINFTSEAKSINEQIYLIDQYLGDS